MDTIHKDWQQPFFEWLSTFVSHAHFAALYQAFNDLESLLSTNQYPHPLTQKLAETSDINAIENLYNCLRTNKGFIRSHGSGIKLSVLRYYSCYFKECQSVCAGNPCRERTLTENALLKQPFENATANSSNQAQSHSENQTKPKTGKKSRRKAQQKYGAHMRLYDKREPIPQGAGTSLIANQEKEQRAQDSIFDPALSEVLQGKQLRLLRQALIANGIRTLEDLRHLNLWAFMNQNELYGINQRQVMYSMVCRSMLAKKMVTADEHWRIVTLRREYTGSSPSEALLGYCRTIAMKYPFKFRNLIGQRMSGTGMVLLTHSRLQVDDLHIDSPKAYMSSAISAEMARVYARWICTMCRDNDLPQEILRSGPANTKEAADKFKEIAFPEKNQSTSIKYVDKRSSNDTLENASDMSVPISLIETAERKCRPHSNPDGYQMLSNRPTTCENDQPQQSTKATLATDSNGTMSFNAFRHFLVQERGVSERTAGSYLTSIRMIESYIQRNHLAFSLLNADAPGAQRIFDLLMARPDFVGINIHRHHLFSVALAQYILFLRQDGSVISGCDQKHARQNKLIETIFDVIHRAENPMTVSEIYQTIVQRGLYRFGSDEPQSAVYNIIMHVYKQTDVRLKEGKDVLIRTKEDGQYVFQVLSAKEATAYASIENHYKQETDISEHIRMAPCAAGHIEIIEPLVPASCIHTGWTSKKHCAVCGVILEPRLPIPALGHDVETLPLIPATCTAEGKTAGSRCKRCNKLLQEQERIPPLGHDVETLPPIPATCTAEGKTSGSRCRRCGEVLKEQTHIPPMGHDIETLPAIAATCNSAGCQSWARCKRCGMTLKEKIVIPALGHDVEIIPKVPATRTSPGMTEGTKCRRCGAILTQQAVIAKLRGQSSTVDRLKALTTKPAEDWPLNRILAFGATTQELKALQDSFSDEFLVNLDVLGSPKCHDSEKKWIDRLNEDAWERAIKLCCSITRIDSEHAEGLRIARGRMMGARDDQMAQALRCSPMELRRKYNGYVNAVTDLFRRHGRALDFMYPHGFFDRSIAEAFFGTTAFNRIEHCCDMIRIHELHGERLAKPVGLIASLKVEASNRRTKVLTDWELLRNYIVEQFDSQPILGSIELDEKEYLMLVEHLRRTYIANAQSYAKMDVDKLVCVALVQIAVRCTGVAYWPIVAETLGIAQTHEMTAALGKCFLRTMKLYKKATFATREYVASIKLHTFVVNAYIGRLFDFLYAYYELDLGRNLEFANLEELQSLIISGEYFSRKQMLLQQTIDALRLIPEASLNRLKTYLGWIDSAFWQQGWRPDHDDRFSRAFQEWCASKDEFSGSWAASDSARRQGKRMHSKPTLSLDMRNGQLNLILPVQRLPFDCDERAGWRIVDGDGRQYNLTCPLVESIMGCRTDELTQELSKNGLFNEITLEFYNGGKTVRSYSIPKDCVRMFNSQGLLISSKRVPAGRVYFLTHSNAEMETESEGIKQKFGAWNLQVIDLQEGETVIFPDDTLAVAGRDAAEGVCGGHPIMGAVVHRKNSDERYPIYGQFPSFLLKLTEEQFARTRFQINDRYLTAQEVCYRRLTLHERTADTGYLVTMPSPRENFQLCHININAPGDGHVRDWTFCYWPDFTYSFDNGEHALPYWDSPRGAVRIHASIPMHGEGVEKNPDGSGEYGFLIPAEPEPLSLDFDWADSVWTLDLNVPVLAWRLEEGPWQMAPVGEIWHKDFPSAINIRTQSNEVCLYVDHDGLQNGQNISFNRRKGEPFIHCDVLALRQWFTRDRIMHSVHIRIEGKVFDFASVYCRSHLVSGRLEAHYANNELHGSFDIIGRGTYCVTLFHAQKEILTQVPIVNGALTTQAPLKSGLYSAIVYEEAEDEFGFDVTWYEIGRVDVKLLNPGDLTGVSMIVKHLDTLNEQPEELGLRAGCYRIELTSRTNSNGVAYIGALQDASGTIQKDLAVFVEFPDLNAIDHCRIYFLEDDEWIPFLYDYSQKRIVTHENRNMPFMERYRRYASLVPEDTFAVVYETN